MRRPHARTSSWPWIKGSEEHTSEPQSRLHLVCRLLPEKKTPRTPRVLERGPEPFPTLAERRLPHVRRLPPRATPRCDADRTPTPTGSPAPRTGLLYAPP